MENFVNSIKDEKLIKAFKLFASKVGNEKINAFIDDIFFIELCNKITIIDKAKINKKFILILSDTSDLDVISLTGLLAHLYGLKIKFLENINFKSNLEKDLVADNFVKNQGFKEEITLFRIQRPYSEDPLHSMQLPFLSFSKYNPKLNLESDLLIKFGLKIFYTQKFSMIFPSSELKGESLLIVPDYDKGIESIYNILKQKEYFEWNG